VPIIRTQWALFSNLAAAVSHVAFRERTSRIEGLTGKTFRGFTLIELLIVIVITGILTAIAIPKFSATKEKAFQATMKADLRNLAVQQESYQFDYHAYTTSFPDGQFRVTTGVTGPSIALTGDGWSAVVGHGSSTKTCAIFVGSTKAAPATQENVPKCSTPQVPDIEGDTGTVTNADTARIEGGP
jgi:type IV pilus assembly protein PilA